MPHGLGRGAARLDDEAGGAPSSSVASERIVVPTDVKLVVQTVLQHVTAEAGSAKQLLAARVLAHLNITKPSGARWQLGHVVGSLLSNFFAWAAGGKRAWLKALPDEVMVWETPKEGSDGRRRSSNPAPQRATALGDLDDAELQHDGTAEPTAGSAAAQRAVAAAQPTPTRVLERVKLDAADRLKRGSGCGNTPRPLARRCLAEQERLDTLVEMVQAHARACPHALKRVDGGEGAYRSSHSMGCVNVFRLVCDGGCSCNWTSATPLPGRLVASDAEGGDA